MHTGRLRNYYRIEARTAAISSVGQQTYTYTKRCNVWGNIKNQTGQEKVNNGIEQAYKRVTIMIRYYSGITKEDRIIDENSGDIYYINDIDNFGEKSEYIILTCSKAMK